MRGLLPRISALGLICATGVLSSAIAQAPDKQNDEIVTQQMLHSTALLNNWPSYNGDYTGRRFTGLTQITPANASQLQAQWVFHSHNAGTLEATPLVVDGVMYMTGSNDAYAIDAVTGKLLWHHVRGVTRGLIDDASGHINRGVAILEIASTCRQTTRTCYVSTLGLEICCGMLPYALGNKNYGATSAPLVVKGQSVCRHLWR